jgi:hypothetical protein
MINQGKRIKGYEREWLWEGALVMQTGVQPYSSWYVPQRYWEDKHGPHNDILPQ